MEADRNYLLYFINDDNEKVYFKIKGKSYRLPKTNSEEYNDEGDMHSSETDEENFDSQIFDLQNILVSTINPTTEDAFCF